MPLSTDNQMLLCQRLFPLLEGRRVNELLASCLAAARRELVAAGFQTGADEISDAHMDAGSGCRAVREYGMEMRDGSDAAGPAIYICARLMVDVGDAGATPRALRLRMTATGAGSNVIISSAPAASRLSRDSVDAMNAHLVLSGGLNRLFGGEAVEAAHGANMGRDLAAQLNEALVP